MLEADRREAEDFLLEIEGAIPLFKGYRLRRDAEGGLCLLGMGGYSYVYEMYEEANPEHCLAVKVIGFGRQTLILEDFLDAVEMQKWFGEQSPHILTILKYTYAHTYTIYEDYRIEDHTNGENVRFLILMERLQPLISKDRFKNVRLNRAGLSTEAEVVRLAIQIGGAIQLMHLNHVLHRDIKLENMFWDEKEQVYKLGDFDIARYTESGTAETIVYTNGYGAPEIGCRTDEDYDATADIYSFGIVLYLLLNNLCFPGSDGYRVNMVQYVPEFVFPAAENAGPELNRVIRKMCSYDRTERYHSMSEVLEELVFIREGIREKIQGAEMPDMATETYREPGLSQEEKAQLQEVRSEKRNRQKQEHLRQKANELMYREMNLQYTAALALIAALLLRSFSIDKSVACDWRLWILPIAVLIEALLLRLREFHITIGIAIILFDIYVMMTVGVSLPCLLLLVCVVQGVRDVFPVMLGGAAGMLLWLASLMTDKLVWLDFLYRVELGWLFLGGLLIAGYRYVVERYCMFELGYLSDHGDGGRINVWDKLPVVILAVGILLKLLDCLGVLTLPMVYEKLHLIAAGVLGLVGNRVTKAWYFTKEEGIEDVPVDE